MGITPALFLDSGNNFTTLPWQLWERLTENWQPRNVIEGLRSAGESRPQSYLARLNSLEIGNLRLSRPPIVVIKPQTAGTLAQAEVSGMLGQEVLKQFIITFDLPNNRLFIRPDPNYRSDPLRYTTIGLQVQTLGTTVTVASVWDGSPASEAGIRAGDEILQVNGKPLDPTATAQDVGRFFHGPEGTKIRLQFRREGKLFERSLVCRNHLP
jgi:hypothetical protein